MRMCLPLVRGVQSNRFIPLLFLAIGPDAACNEITEAEPTSLNDAAEPDGDAAADVAHGGTAGSGGSEKTDSGGSFGGITGASNGGLAGTGGTPSGGTAAADAGLGGSAAGGSGSDGLANWCNLPPDPQPEDAQIGTCPAAVAPTSCWKTRAIAPACALRSVDIDAAGNAHVECSGTYLREANGSFTSEIPPQSLGSLALDSGGTVYSCGAGQLTSGQYTGIVYARTAGSWSKILELSLGEWELEPPTSCVLAAAGGTVHALFTQPKYPFSATKEYTYIATGSTSVFTAGEMPSKGAGFDLITGAGATADLVQGSSVHHAYIALVSGQFPVQWEQVAGAEENGDERISLVREGSDVAFVYDAWTLLSDFVTYDRRINFAVRCSGAWRRWHAGCPGPEFERIVPRAIAHAGTVHYLSVNSFIPPTIDAPLYLNTLANGTRSRELLSGMSLPASLALAPDGKRHIVYRSANNLVHAVSCDI